MTTAYLCLGGNVGDVRVTLARAAALLGERGQTLLASSPFYRTPPWGPVAQPAYLNQVIAVDSPGTPRELLSVALEVERLLGRDRSQEERFGPRRIDIDILAFGDAQVDEPDLQLPHPRLLQRAFALVPLLDVAPEIIIGGVRAREALAALDRTGIVPVP